MLAAMHSGVFTTREAGMVGVTRDTLTAAVRHGRLRRLARGLYAAGPAPDRPEARHLELVRALLVEYPDAVLAGRSAVLAHGLPTWGVPLGLALLHRPVERQLRRSGAVIRPLDPVAGSVDAPPGRTTPVADSVVQVALDHGTVAGVVSCDAALHTGMTTQEAIHRSLQERAGHRRIQRAWAMAGLMDPSSESPGESRLRVVLVTGGIEVESQPVIRDGRGEVIARGDLRVAGTRVLIEFDGAVKYTDGGPEALFAEKRREDRIRALGWVVVRVTWADLMRPDRILAAVRRAVAVAAHLAPVA